MDAKEITSAQMMGYGDLNMRNRREQVPVVRVFYNDGRAEDVYDVWHVLYKGC